MDRAKLLGEEKIGKLLLKFSIPAIVGMVVNAIYNIVDRIFIGNFVDSLGLGGITIAFPIMIIIMAFGMLIGIGATSLISIRLGEGKREEAELILGNAMVLLIIISLTLSIFGLIFLDPILKLFGASPQILPYAKEYLSIILLGAVFQSIGFGMNNFIRADGSPKMAMATMLIGAILNTILDPIFIIVFNMGIKGAALATIISQAVSAAWVLNYFFSGKSSLVVKKENWKLKPHIVKNILAIGSAPFAMQVAASGITTLLNRSLITYGGDLAVSAYGAINSFSTILLMPIFGINQGSQPIIGYNYGAKNYDRVKKAFLLAITAATTITIIGFVVTRMFPSQLVALFNSKDKELVNIGANGMKIFFTMLPLIGFQIVSSNYFQATGKPKQAMLLSLSRQVLMLIPAILILPRFFDLNGVWMAGPTADFFSSLLTGTFILIELKKLQKLHLENQ
ncbi:putative efflux protein, MATE family [Proteiniborus ethanoligenes]|uniref:Multidrug export protein MepA n=1 Tax=Proteiniborus ethanoligenes TaxID=415015 RepID=A0A1H3KWX9_9FIRM|nr:MATE family efflux transporter [Proteiniborus ethanoligenes]SDY56526.1 putative efflux protein, MATE family [Proteiniborus ethanoligenes]